MPVTGKAKTNEKRHPCPKFSKSCFALKVSHKRFKDKRFKTKQTPQEFRKQRCEGATGHIRK